MPIKCDVNIEPAGQEQFHAVDKILMRNAFDIHNTIGRFCDENIYQEELSKRCHDSFNVNTEVRIRVSHQDFSKSYFLDMCYLRDTYYAITKPYIIK